MIIILLLDFLKENRDIEYASDDEPYYTQPILVPTIYESRDKEKTDKVLSKRFIPRKRSKMIISEDMFK